MARKVVFFAHAGFSGTDTAQGFIFDDDVTDEELSDEAWQFGVEHAESYGVYPLTDDITNEELEDCPDSYSEGIEGWWEDYVPEKHDGKITYGNGEPMFDDCTRK